MKGKNEEMGGEKERKWEAGAEGGSKGRRGGCTLLDKNETVRGEIESEPCWVDEFLHIP